MNNLNTAVFTVCNLAYFNKAQVLAKSLYDNNNMTLKIFLFDKKRNIYYDKSICQIFWVEDLAIPNFEYLAFKYNVIELTTAMKPFLSLYLLNSYSKIIFFDPDVMIFDSINPIIYDLDNHEFILTPHYITPDYESVNKDIILMRFGFFNLGFFANNNSEKSIKLLRWWYNKCFYECYDDTQFGIFTDQKWLSIAPFYFPFIKILNLFTCNVAYWNLFERELINKNDKFYINNTEESSKLIFFHFSSLSNNNNSITYKQFDIGSNSIDLLSKLTILYKSILNNYPTCIPDYKYSYDYFDNQYYISPTLRRAYAASIDYFDISQNPFIMTPKMKRFMNLNNLVQKDNYNFTNPNLSDFEKNKHLLNMSFIFLRLVLKIAGPSKFMNLSRYFHYISSYNRILNFWKY